MEFHYQQKRITLEGTSLAVSWLKHGLLMYGAWVKPLIRKLRSQVQRGVAKFKKKKKKPTRNGEVFTSNNI